VIKPVDLIGAWNLERFTIRVDGRPPLYPFGEDAHGMLVYAASGHMSAVLSHGTRAPLGVSRLENARRATSQQRAEAFDSYLSYAGTWRLDGETVAHTVTLSLTPDAVGARNIRHARIEQERLVLTYQITPQSGRTRFYELIWRKLT